MSAVGAVKLLCGLSAIVGLLTLLTSCWTFASLIVYNNHWKSNKFNLSTTQSNFQQLDNQQYNEEHEGNEEPIKTIRDYKLLHSQVDKIWFRLDLMTDYFANSLILYTWSVNIVTLFQILMSATILFLAKRKIPTRSKHLVGIHFLAFVVLLICFFLPMGYNRKRDCHHNATTFNVHFMSVIDEYHKIGFKYIIYDLNPYYLVVGVDICLTFIVLISVCCLMRCMGQDFNPAQKNRNSMFY